MTEVVGSDGTTVVSRTSYDPWGKLSESGTLQIDFAYAGQYFDRATGLNLALYRDYDSQLGRWISNDPFGLRGGENLYAYVANTPTNLVDPLGLAPDQCSVEKSNRCEDYEKCLDQCNNDADETDLVCRIRYGDNTDAYLSCTATLDAVAIRCRANCWFNHRCH